MIKITESDEGCETNPECSLICEEDPKATHNATRVCETLCPPMEDEADVWEIREWGTDIPVGLR